MEFEQNKDDSRKNKLNPLLSRKFELFIIKGPNCKKSVLNIRDLRSSYIGSLVTIRAIVVRVSDVKPMIQVACYICDVCGAEIY